MAIKYQTYMDHITKLEHDSQRSVAFGLSDQIKERVAKIREIRAERERRMTEAGIPDLDEEETAVKSELREMARDYREIVGVNWVDQDGYARISVEGVSHKYTTETVDQSAATLHSMIGELGELLTDGSIIVANIEGQKLTPAQYVEFASKHDVPREELMTVLVMLQQYYESQQQEAMLRAEAMRNALDKLAAARHTSSTPEKLAVI